MKQYIYIYIYDYTIDKYKKKIDYFQKNKLLKYAKHVQILQKLTQN